jgi:hypothetical protein
MDAESGGKLVKLGVTFDDFVINEDGTEWSQICLECVDKHKISTFYLDNEGSGICGVEGCHNEADFYIDFDEGRVTGG